MTSHMQTAAWHEVTYPSLAPTPIARWGHRLLRITPTLLLLFGGFGSLSTEGHYLGDLWLFDTITHSWQSLTATGDLPSPRSNYTLHFNPTANEVLLFGGGSNTKQRFNAVHTLNLQTLQWTKEAERTDCPAPWERTYHVAEYLHPYLIVFGGESAVATDLDDLWAYDTRTHEWNSLHPTGNKPTKRRFAASALVGTQLYVVGGCHGNYNLLGDVYRIDLQSLLEGRSSNLQWECLVKGNKLLERWGHSCDVLDGKLFLWAGRISANSDNQDLLQFDPLTSAVREVRQIDSPKARRRHASALIGRSLVIFGGYNGKYLNDCHYVNLPEQTYSSTSVPVFRASSQQELIRKVEEYQKLIRPTLTLVVWKEGHLVGTVKTNEARLTKKSLYFTHLISSERQREGKNDELWVELPQESSLLAFRCAHLGIIEDILFVDSNSNLKHPIALAKTLQYFALTHLQQSMEKYFHSQLSSLNCHQLLDCAIELNMPTLERSSAVLCLKTPENLISEDQTTFLSQTQCRSDTSQNCNAWLAAKRCNVLTSTMQNMRFDIEQTRIRQGQTCFFDRSVNKIKGIFSSQDCRIEASMLPPKPVTPEKQSCLDKLRAFMSSLYPGR